VLTIAELTDAEAAGLGTWQVRLSRALHAVTRCAKTYVVQFAEAQRFSHVHFHVIPRADLQRHRGR
jgi:diadenosine tetraphosphate (Ap4A) HIT family hydrolase